MATCPRCGSDAPEGDRFCRTCGGYLAAAPGFDEGETQQLPRPDPRESRPPAIPAIDDSEEPPAPQEQGGDASFDTAQLPMQAYPVEPPAQDSWLDEPDQGWYQDRDDQQGPPPDQGFPPAGPYEQQPGVGPPFPPPYGQAPPHDQTMPLGQAPPYEPGPAPGQGPPFGQAPPYGGQGDGFEGAGYYPYDEGTPKRGNSGRTAILAVVGAIAVVALVFGGVLFIGSHRHGTADAGSTKSASAPGSGSASASPNSSRSGAATPQQQAVAVNKLLNRAVSGKSMLASAYNDALACKISPADAAAQFEQAAKNRRAIVTSAKTLDTSKLSGGARIKQLLINMYSTSARADDAFADWAHAGDDAGQSCLKGNAKRTKGNSLSIRAGRQKRSFTKVWNPVASTYGQPQRTKNSL